jgi:excisionase family DNA binding protein
VGTEVLPLLSAKRLGELLDVKEKTLYDWARTGKIPSHRINGLVRFNLDEVLKCLN